MNQTKQRWAIKTTKINDLIPFFFLKNKQYKRLVTVACNPQSLLIFFCRLKWRVNVLTIMMLQQSEMSGIIQPLNLPPGFPRMLQHGHGGILHTDLMRHYRAASEYTGQKTLNR